MGYSLNKRYYDKYAKELNATKDRLFIEAIKGIIEDMSLIELYDLVADAINAKDERFNYVKDRLILPSSDDLENEVIMVRVLNKDSCVYFISGQAEYNENYKMIRIIDQIYAYTNYEVVFNTENNEIIFYNSMETVAGKSKNYIKLNETEIIYDEMNDNHRECIVFLLSIIGDFFYDFDEDNENNITELKKGE